MITIATFNVNSIKARLPNLLAWLDEARPDMVLLQELKCMDEAFPAMEIEERGYNIASHGQKTYNGVAILSKFPLDDVVRGLPPLEPSPLAGEGWMGGLDNAALHFNAPSPSLSRKGRGTTEPMAANAQNFTPASDEGWMGGLDNKALHFNAPSPSLSRKGRGTTEPMAASAPNFTPASDEMPDTQARYIEAVVSINGGAMRVASVYVPNGQDVGSDKFPYKLKFLERLRAHWAERLTYHEVAVLGGDFNVAPAPIDVYDHAGLDGSVCYHPAERARLHALMHLGFYDAFRIANPTAQQFSWWDYRGSGYERGHGLRIDHLLLSPMAVDRLERCIIDESPRAQEKPSDHAPVIATLAC